MTVQQRKKILPLALEKLFQDFVSQTSQNDTYKGHRLLAVDGSDIQIPTNSEDVVVLCQDLVQVKMRNFGPMSRFSTS